MTTDHTAIFDNNPQYYAPEQQQTDNPQSKFVLTEDPNQLNQQDPQNYRNPHQHTPQFYRLQNHPPPTHTITTKINQQTKNTIIDTGASISATCSCTFSPSPHHDFHTTRIFNTASGPQNFPIFNVLFKFRKEHLWS
eukprot:GHVP01033210.1.p1 GENE.GHVP01033210.1~~GHVP01033210.1.p1  ORF type:complete len:137 (+),score=21.17 GHVP01033210.1:394-804(+)